MKRNLFFSPLILLLADAAAGGGGASTPPAAETPADKIKRLETELASANDRIADFEAAAATQSAEEKLIGEKMRTGLSRDQAQAVIRRQKEHDEAIEKLWATRRQEILDVLTEHDCLSGRVSKQARTEIREINGAITIDEIKTAQAAFAASEAASAASGKKDKSK